MVLLCLAPLIFKNEVHSASGNLVLLRDNQQPMLMGSSCEFVFRRLSACTWSRSCCRGELPATGERAAENASGIPCIHLHTGTGQISFLGEVPAIQNFHHNKTGTSGWRKWVWTFGAPTDRERWSISAFYLISLKKNLITTTKETFCVPHPTFPVIKNPLQLRVKSILVLCYKYFVTVSIITLFEIAMIFFNNSCK